MPAKIGCDAHKQFSVFVTIDGKGKTSPAVRVEHHRQEYIDFSTPCRRGARSPSKPPATGTG
jgi:hypothetical protein